MKNTTQALSNANQYLALNAMSKIAVCGKNEFSKDKEAVAAYMQAEVTPKTRQFNSVLERLAYLVENDYYEKDKIAQFSINELESLYALADSYDYQFPSLMGAMKFYNAYCLRNSENNEYLETFAQRVVANAIMLSDGNFEDATALVRSMMAKIFQPATPTFLNALKKQRGEYVSCYLLRMEDNMESIARIVGTCLQLSKRGGGVAVALTNLREAGAPIKKIVDNATGVIPVMKLLEDSFSYANQLGQRQGAGAVYLHAHHPDIMLFLDTKRENADEKIRIKSLSLGVVIPDVTFELAKQDKDMALFSPYDVARVYGKPFCDISVSDEYDAMLANPEITKTFVNARKFFQTIAELHFESGYPYILFEDTVNRNNAHPERIIMSNLCSEILQPSTMSTYKEDMSFDEIGNDISCNLASINIAALMQSGSEFDAHIYNAVKALDYVSHNSSLECAPSIKKGNSENHAIGLGAMNLHGFLATHEMYYDSEEAIDFTNIYFYTTAYSAFKASNRLAKERKTTFSGFDKSKFANGEYFLKYTHCDRDEYTPKTQKVGDVFYRYGVTIPSQEDWKSLVEDIKIYGLVNSHLMAIAPTGSISYLSSCTPSLQPAVAPVEVRKEGKMGRIYVPAYELSDDNMKYYEQGAYEVGPHPIIDIAATAQKHIDQGVSLTLFMNDNATTRDLNRAYVRAFTKKCGTIYYVRVRQDVLEGSENLECTSCQI